VLSVCIHKSQSLHLDVSLDVKSIVIVKIVTTMNTKAFTNLLIITIVFLLGLVGCGDKEAEAKKLGFNSYAEMGSIQSKGFNTKKEYEEWSLAQTIKAYGCSGKEQLEEARKKIGNNNCRDLEKYEAEIEKTKSEEERKINSDFAVKCTKENEGGYEYIIGVASENSIYYAYKADIETQDKQLEKLGIDTNFYGAKASNPVKTTEAYEFSGTNGIRSTYFRLDRKTGLLTRNIQGFNERTTPFNCVNIGGDERSKILNRLLNKLASEQKKIDESRQTEQRKIEEYNKKKPQF